MQWEWTYFGPNRVFSNDLIPRKTLILILYEIPKWWTILMLQIATCKCSLICFLMTFRQYNWKKSATKTHLYSTYIHSFKHHARCRQTACFLTRQTRKRPDWAWVWHLWKVLSFLHRRLSRFSTFCIRRHLTAVSSRLAGLMRWAVCLHTRISCFSSAGRHKSGQDKGFSCRTGKYESR